MKDNYIIKLQKYLKDYMKNNDIKNVVIGLSGGIDSSLSTTIVADCINLKNIFVYFIDIESDKKDFKDAQLVCDNLGLNLNYLNLTRSYKRLIKELNIKDDIQKANVKSRLRMISLYNFAFEKKALVIGNSNLDELYLGYFTKHGDGACDLNLLGGLLKKDIYLYAQQFNIPKEIINKKPSSGLIKNSTDEMELKLKYKDIDAFLENKSVDKNSKNIIEKLHNKNKHKLTYNKYVNKSNKYRKV